MLERVSARRILPIFLIVALTAIYGIAWFRPAIGLAEIDGATLMEAVTHHGSLPPLFPALLALFAAVSRQPQWLKFAPLLCTFFWLLLTKRLLTKMGASRESAWVLILITAASPAVEYLATGLFPESLFALLAAACLLALLDEKPLLAGVCAGLATITLTAGVSLIAACLLTLVAHRRLRTAIIFTITAMIFAAPWLGWTLANGGFPLSKLHANELAILLSSNAEILAAAPFTLLSGWANLYPGLLTAVALLIVLIRRRQFVPDVFVGLYCLALLLRIESPLHAFAPILPLFLWILWRVAQTGRFATITKATALAMLAPALWFGAAALSEKKSPDNLHQDDWHQMQTLFSFIRSNTPADSVLLANLNPVFYLNTGRTTVRGFELDPYRAYYGPPGSLVSPDQLHASILHDRVSYVVLTPDRDRPESASFHRAVAALERGGVLEAVSVPGGSSEYRILRVTILRLTK
jgi:hypothetical protein